MAEPSEQRMKRLKGSGHWKPFVERRNALKAKGHTAKEADSIASSEFTAEKLGVAAAPVDLDNPSTPDAPVGPATAGDFEGKQSLGLANDILWVYENVSLKDVSPKNAPSSGAA